MASMEGKIVAITGGASGIGLATAKVLSARGATVWLADLNAKDLHNAVGQILSFHSRHDSDIMTSVVDVSDSAAVNAWIDNIIRKFGRLDCAANIAGIGDPYKPLREKTDEDWDRVMNVNAKGVFYCMRKQCQVMKEGASIVNVASVAGLQGTPCIGCYAASKHAVAGLTRTAAREEGVRGIRINAVAPGVIRTPMTAPFHSGDSKGGASGGGTELLQPILDRSSMKRMAEPEEVGRVIAFLLSDDASFQTGTVVPVDGGYGC